ncbi:unnamed protein product [Symbiodinium microadriaticum]|nr:unnamed protein product [Symbiodinium microadriaticum]
MARARISPDLIFLNSCISACKNDGQWELALHLLGQFPFYGIVPDEITYTACMGACEHGGQFQKALDLFFLMHRTIPDRVMLNAGISLFGRSGQWQLACDLLLRMPALGATLLTQDFNAAIAACAISHEWKSALQLLADMPSAQSEPDDISLASAITACGRSRMWQKSLGLFAELISRGFRPRQDTYNQVLDAVCTEKISFDLFREALRQSTWPLMTTTERSVLDLHDHSPGSGMLALLWWLAKVVPDQLRPTGRSKFVVVTGYRKHSSYWNKSDMTATIKNLLDHCGLPWEAPDSEDGKGYLILDLTNQDPARLREFFK